VGCLETMDVNSFSRVIGCAKVATIGRSKSIYCELQRSVRRIGSVII